VVVKTKQNDLQSSTFKAKESKITSINQLYDIEKQHKGQRRGAQLALRQRCD